MKEIKFDYKKRKTESRHRGNSFFQIPRFFSPSSNRKKEEKKKKQRKKSPHKRKMESF